MPRGQRTCLRDSGEVMDQAAAVIVTRPEPDNTRLCARLTEVGWRTWSCPLIGIGPRPLGHVERQAVQNLERYDHVVFVSRNAARIGMAVIDQFWTRLPAAPTWFAVGEGTARELEPFGIHAQVPPLATSEGLLGIAQLQFVRGVRCLLVRGPVGRTVLRDTLVQLGAIVDELQVYERSSLPDAGDVLDDALQAGARLVVVTSGEILDYLEELLAPGLKAEVTVVVPSDRIAARAAALGYVVQVSMGAGDDAIIQALEASTLGSAS